MTGLVFSIIVGVMVTLGALFSVCYSRRSSIWLIIFGSIFGSLLFKSIMSCWIKSEVVTDIAGMIFVAVYILAVLIKNDSVKHFTEERLER